MDVILISTTDIKAERGDARNRMLQSLIDSERTLSGARMVLGLLLQNCATSALPVFAAGMPSFVRPLISTPGRLPLSTARNLLLARLESDGVILRDTLVGFPDDDCWYPPAFLAQVAGLFTRDATLDFWFCRYASNPVQSAFMREALVSARLSEIVRNASSNTMFLRGRVIDAVGRFDETLGVGTPLGGGEDMDYALRARRVAREVVYCDAPLVGHRDKSPEVRSRYYVSGLVVLARHARYGAVMEFIRKIAVGVYLILRRELTFANFAKALHTALVEFRPAVGQAAQPIKPSR
jgi:hypothetical protein